MGIFLLMFAYVFIMGLFCRQKSVVDYYSKQKYYVSGAQAFLVVALPVFFIGLRTDFNDTYAYISAFKFLPTSFSSIQRRFATSKSVSWLVYEWVIKRFISSNPNVFLLITAIIQSAAVVKIYRRYSNDYCYSMLLFFLSCAFLNLMGAIRQFMAIAVLLFFSDWLFNDKLLRYAVVVLFAATIHTSAIIWLPIIFAVRGKAGNIRVVLIAIVTMAAIVFLDRFTGLLADSLEGTMYAGYTNQFARDDGANIMHSVIASIPVLLWIYGRRTIDYQNDALVNTLINISIVGLMISLLAHFTSGILLGRMMVYFTIYNYALLPVLFEKIFSNGNARSVRVACVAGYAAYALYYMYATGIRYVSSVLGMY